MPVDQSAEPLQRDVVLWRGDDDPPLVWEFGDETTPNVLNGSDFILTVQWIGGEIERRSGGDGGLVVDVAARTLTWPYSTSDSAPIPRGDARYEIKRLIDDETRTYTRTWVWGVLTLKSGLLRA